MTQDQFKMKVIAIFKGKNGSLGYVTGKEYSLLFRTDFKVVIVDLDRITPRDSGGSLCMYDSVRSFLDNWEVVQ